MQSVNSWLSIQIPFASTALIRAEPIRFAGRRLTDPVSQGSARLLINNTATCLIMVRLAIRFGQSIPAIRVSFRLRLVSSHCLPTVRSPPGLVVLRGGCLDSSTKNIEGDCIEVMRNFPSASIDLVLTDPPYGISLQAQPKTSKFHGIRIANDDHLGWLPSWSGELYRVAKNIAYIFC